MKKVLLAALASVLLILCACQTDAGTVPTSTTTTDTVHQRAAMTNYLRTFNTTLNSLPQAAQYTNFPVKDLNAFDHQPIMEVTGGNISVYETGLQTIKTETVPDIAPARSIHDTGLTLVADTLNVLKELQTALAADNQSAWSQAADNYNALLPRVSAYYRLIESSADQYNITDAEIDYRYRGK